MNCREAYELILEADPADLRAEADAPLARHLRTCDRCAARAALILAAQARLAGALSARRPRMPTEPAVPAAAPRARHLRGRRRLAWRAAPALLAATLAGILIARSGDRPPAREQRVDPSVEPAPPTVAQTPSGRNVVVYETDNPNIVIVWLY